MHTDPQYKRTNRDCRNKLDEYDTVTQNDHVDQIMRLDCEKERHETLEEKEEMMLYRKCYSQWPNDVPNDSYDAIPFSKRNDKAMDEHAATF